MGLEIAAWVMRYITEVDESEVKALTFRFAERTWEPPLRVTIKINFNVAFNAHLSMFVSVVVAKNAQGEIIAFTS